MSSKKNLSLYVIEDGGGTTFNSEKNVSLQVACPLLDKQQRNGWLTAMQAEKKDFANYIFRIKGLAHRILSFGWILYMLTDFIEAIFLIDYNK